MASQLEWEAIRGQDVRFRRDESVALACHVYFGGVSGSAWLLVADLHSVSLVHELAEYRSLPRSSHRTRLGSQPRAEDFRLSIDGIRQIAGISPDRERRV
jgi:hypothetical protein